MTANRVFFDHYSQFPAEEWRWPNFQPVEIACRGDGSLMVDFHSMDCLQALRDMLDEPIYLNSAYRSPAWNKTVGGAEKSQHLKALAFDVSMRNHDPYQFIAAAQECGFTSFGHYPDQGFLHIDTRETPARWYVPRAFPKLDDTPDPHAILSRGPAPVPVAPPAPANAAVDVHKLRRMRRAVFGRR